MIRFAPAGGPRMAQFIAMQNGRDAPPAANPIARTGHWLKGIVLGASGQGVRP